MDLGAYIQIEDLEKIAKDNNIEVPRLRGYRLMKDEQIVPSEEIKKLMKDCEVMVCERLCQAEPFWSSYPDYYCSSSYTDFLRDYFLIKKLDEDGYKKYVGIRWDRIHGWKRKVLKFAIKKQKRRIQKQLDMYNKYVGNENVLYIHARVGGDNWNYYDCNHLLNKPWFLDKVDDYFDDTYCDIYALINQ